MDLQTALVCLAVFLVSAVVVYLISVLGMRETTYEEAIAQQRRKDEESLQLKKTDKISSKVDKKHKKWGRKSKEKSEGKGDDEDLHVGFKPEAEIIPELKEEERERRASASLLSKTGKKPESILVNKKQKEKSPSLAREETKEESPAAANHKNTAKNSNDQQQTVAPTTAPSQPINKKGNNSKELKGESVVSEVDSKEGSPAVGTGNEAGAGKTGGRSGKSRESSSEKEDEETNNKASKKQQQSSDSKAKTTGNSAPATTTTTTAVKVDLVAVKSNDNSAAPSPVKKAKKSKADDEILTCNRLTTIIKSSFLSPSEITSLIETLLNKQQAESGNEEWLKIGQKVDPITALRKQLQEKEEALAEEKLRSQTAGTKLRDLRQEANAEKTRFAQMERNLKDRHQQEIQTTHSHLQMATAEANNLRNQLQQLQAKLNEEHLIAKKQMDEKNQLNQALNLSENNNKALQLEIESLRAALVDGQNHIMNANGNSEKLLNDNKQLQEHLHQIELSKQEEENEFTQKLNELAQQHHLRGEENAHLLKLLEESRSFEEEVNRLKTTIAEMNAQSENSQSQLLSYVEELKKEKLNLEKQMGNLQINFNQQNADLIQANDQLAALEEEKDHLANELSKVSEREEAEGREGSGDGSLHDKSNGHITEGEEITKIALVEHENILHEKEKMVERLTSEMNEKNNELTDICNQLTAAKEEINRLESEANLQKQKNNELREKNWKVVEALNAAEKSSTDKIRQADKIAHERLLEVQKGEQKFAQEALERIFPEIRIDKSIVYPEWVSQFEKQAQQTIENFSKLSQSSGADDELQNKYNSLENAYNKLQSTVQNYNDVLAQTEGMLNKLQGSVEEEEKRWKEKLEAKDTELQKLLEERRSLEISLEQLHAAENATAEMQDKLKELHQKLQSEENERRLLEKYKSEAEISASNFHQKLNETEEQLNKLQSEKESLLESAKERETLKDDLDRMELQVKELSSANTKLKGQLKIGQDALRAEQDAVLQLQEELKLYRNETKQLNATNGQATDNGDTVSTPPPFESSRCKGELELKNSSSLGINSSSPFSLISQATPTSQPPLSTSSSEQLMMSSLKKSKKRGVLGRK